jgi:hypothetical protein
MTQLITPAGTTRVYAIEHGYQLNYELDSVWFDKTKALERLAVLKKHAKDNSLKIGWKASPWCVIKLGEKWHRVNVNPVLQSAFYS